MDKKEILSGAISSSESYCDGIISSSNPSYITGVFLNIGIVKQKHSHQGSILLDKILAFDKAEVAGTNIGQINMITVSSFCGPSGLMWGYDIAKHSDIKEGAELKFVAENGRKIPVFSAKPLQDALLRLFGTVDDKRFPLMPGAHVPCASKTIELKGPKHIYAAMAFGIAENRDSNACLFMEDVGIMSSITESGKKKVRNKILDDMVDSVLEVGRNQGTKYKTIFFDMVECRIKKDEIGCALVAAPYFKLAKNAIIANDVSLMADVSLESWEKSVEHFFIDKKI